MRDPFEELKNLDVAGSALPAHEVRRRGDRMRRRRTALQAVGAAAAVAVIASAGAMVTGNPNSAPVPPGPANPSPSPSPSQESTPRATWVTAIPEDFPIDRGLPAAGGDVRAWESARELDTALAASPCGESEQPAVVAADGLRVQVDPPDSRTWRHLMLFEDEAAASGVLDRAVSADVRCLAALQGVPADAAAGPEEMRWSQGVFSRGEASVVEVVGLAYARGTETRVPGRSLIRVVQVGNAVLVALHSDASSASAEDSAARSFALHVDEVADEMCLFAAEGCGGPEPVEPEPLAHVLDAEQLAAATEVSGWRPVDGLLEHPFVCAEESTEALAGNRTDTRQFAVMDGTEVRAMAITTVLDFDPPEWKTDGYDRAAGWLRSCDRPLDRDHVVPEHGTNPYGEVNGGETARGAWTWRTVKTTAPEICEECDAAWNHHQGVALAGDRLVLLQVSYPTEIAAPAVEPGVPFLDVLGAAADLASKSLPSTDGTPMTFGPTGVGDVELGTPVAELQALGLLGDDLEGCNSFAAVEDRFSGHASDTEGVVWLWADPPRSTPQGIGFASTRSEAEAAYGPLRPLGWNDMLVAGVPGHPGTSYAFSFDGEVVMELALLDDASYCTR